MKELIADSDVQARGMKAVADRTPQAGGAVSLMDLSVEAECFGAPIRVSDDEVPTVTGPVISTEVEEDERMEQAEALEVPPIGAGRTQIYIDAIEKAMGLIEDRPVFAGVIGPFSLDVYKRQVLYCAENGQVLFDQEMDTPAHPASITKLMTALLVLESGIDLDQTVTVSHDAVYSIERGSTHIALDEGEQVTLEQMMYAMLLTSANDAANVLAEAVDGTQQAFAKHMTERAKELGCRHTNFVNAHGLDDRLHYTTAYDMACITRELLQYDCLLYTSRCV